LTVARIRIVGVGGGGGNAINHMMARGVYGVDFIAVNTDAFALSRSEAPTRICIGKNITRFLGTGGSLERGERAALASADQIREAIEGSDMVFITAGMGGGTGTGAAPVIAKLAQESGIFTIAIVTRPFLFEGGRHAQIAEVGIERLKSLADTLIVISNDRLLDMIDEQTSLNDAFHLANDVLYQSVQAISELITVPGLINLDFADVRTVMSTPGATLIGVGRATGPSRARTAARQAACSPLLDMTIDGARSILVNIAAGPELCLQEIHQATAIIKNAIHPAANFIFGTVIDSRLNDELRVTVIATGVGQSALYAQASSSPAELTYETDPLMHDPALKPVEALHSGQSTYSLEDYTVPAFLRNA
jgi:cell division protein FtsZ